MTLNDLERPKRTSVYEPEGKAIIFRAKAKFFGQKPTAKNEKKYFFCIY